MISIPRKMNNEESKLYALIVIEERAIALSKAKIFAAKNRLKIWA